MCNEMHLMRCTLLVLCNEVQLRCNVPRATCNVQCAMRCKVVNCTLCNGQIFIGRSVYNIFEQLSTSIRFFYLTNFTPNYTCQYTYSILAACVSQHPWSVVAPVFTPSAVRNRCVSNFLLPSRRAASPLHWMLVPCDVDVGGMLVYLELCTSNLHSCLSLIDP